MSQTRHLQRDIFIFFVSIGVVNCISTEICTSKARNFPLITFVDTPGLVDGDMRYPYDVDKAILWLGMPRSYRVIGTALDCITCHSCRGGGSAHSIAYPYRSRCGRPGRLADLVFVFFDPIGQALRKHTLDVVGSRACVCVCMCVCVCVCVCVFVCVCGYAFVHML